MNKVALARDFALRAHMGQTYGDRSYLYHLDMTVNILSGYREDLKIAGYLHDILEDTAATSDQIEFYFGKRVKELVEGVTDPIGPNRKVRKALLYERFALLGIDDEVLILKVADRLANVKYSVANRSKIFWMYVKEHKDFERACYRKGQCEELWAELNRLIYVTGILRHVK